MKPPLHGQMFAELTVAGKARRTREAYVARVAAFDAFPPGPLAQATRADLAAFISHLADDRHLPPPRP